MPKILFLTPEFPPSKLTGAIRPAKFAKYLKRFGWDVTVLTFEHDDTTQEKLLNDLEGVRIETCGKVKKYVVNDIGISFLFQAYKPAIKLANEITPDYVLVSVPTFMNTILALVLNLKFGIKYILDYRDLWVADPYPVRGFKSKAFRLISKIVEPIILKFAYLSYYVSDEMLKDQKKQYPFLRHKKTAVISTGYDADDVGSIKAASKKNGFIAHIGNADPDMNIKDFVFLINNQSISQLLVSSKLKFLFVGRKNSFLQDELCKPENAHLKFFFEFNDYVPHNKALQLMADSSGLLILGSNSQQRLNRKVFEYTALNRNVFYLGNVNSPTASVVSDCGGCVSDISNMVDRFFYFLKNLTDENAELNFDYSKARLVQKLIQQLD